MPAPTTVVWFRRDLRVHDHPALRHAVDGGGRIAPLFVIDEHLLHGRWQSPNRAWFMAGSVAALARELRERGAGLSILHGDPTDLVPRFAAAIRASRVVASRDYAPYGLRRDASVAGALRGRGIAFEAGRGILVHEPEAIQRSGGGGFSIFSPFHRAWSATERRPVAEAPDAIRGVDVRSLDGNLAGLGPESILSAAGLSAPTADPNLLLEPGEPAARRRLDAWVESGRLRAYAADRDRLDLDGTSRLSQDLRWGLISPVEVLARCRTDGSGPARFATEIAWRDFYAHLLFREPRVARSSFRTEFDGVPWTTGSVAVEAWKQGRTGFPIVDAAMRQLVKTGWMHNRARMIVASFLTKDLLVDWRVGEAFFMQHLVDGDPASNNGGWQWAASTGTDPQPYFRIFNPVLQGRRHDPAGGYVRRWVPELTSVAASEIHHPSPATRRAVGYPDPIVDHAEARARAIAAFAAASGGASGSDR